ncbi:hypothetical protein PIB30_027034 [Stylosanthes scabra]|uniref:Uncharacterized protein n=1 Tax=Stylosanthes scabra TaxID=79078 RepID=A0ABU6RAZ3_9FABA|nr:hypothetical protein [Stylosanthes scabra]
MIYYRIPISVVALGVKYGCFAIEADEDLQVLFNCRSGSAPNPHSAIVARPSRLVIQHDPEAHQVASPTFGIYHEAADCVGDLEDTRSFGELADAIAAAPHAVPVPHVERDPEPFVDEALRANDSDDEPTFFEGDNDNDSGPVPT